MWRVQLISRVLADVLLQEIEVQGAIVAGCHRAAEGVVFRPVGCDAIVGEVAGHAVARPLVAAVHAAADRVRHHCVVTESLKGTRRVIAIPTAIGEGKDLRVVVVAVLVDEEELGVGGHLRDLPLGAYTKLEGNR